MISEKENSYFFLYLNILAYIYQFCADIMLHTVKDKNEQTDMLKTLRQYSKNILLDNLV